jgi:hypothetical protein
MEKVETLVTARLRPTIEKGDPFDRMPARMRDKSASLGVDR